MTAINNRKIESALLKKGFRRDDSHHVYFWLFIGDKKTSVKTWVSHGHSDCGNRLISWMSKQLSISKEQFVALVSCPLKHEEYVEILRKQNRIM